MNGVGGSSSSIAAMDAVSASASEWQDASLLAELNGRLLLPQSALASSASADDYDCGRPHKGNASGHLHSPALSFVRLIRSACLLPLTRLKLSHPSLHESLTGLVLPVVLAVTIVCSIPLSFYTPGQEATLPYEVRGGTFSEIVVGWDALLHLSIWPIVTLTSAAGFLLAHHRERTANNNNNSNANANNSNGDAEKGGGDQQPPPQPSRRRYCSTCVEKQQARLERALLTPRMKRCCHKIHSRWPLRAEGTLVGGIALLFSVLTSTQSQLQIVSPGWLWNPGMWGKYRVYRPAGIEKALEGVCVEEYLDADGGANAMAAMVDNPLPLCLKESSWRALSADALSSRNPEDVDAVLKGVRYARQPDHGMIINVMSRDTIGAIEPFRKNVEGLLPFFDKVAVVVFENDSRDGSREAFQSWADDVKGRYVVDVMECDDAPNCVFGESHRYDSTEADDYWKSSAIGRMAEFRQRMVDYIVEGDTYDDYSHMIVVDLDLKVSLSPLGILHTLGKRPDAAVASSGRQAWPASLGTFAPPYDFSAFRALRSPKNSRILDLHRRFCELMPPGDRWRNQCDAVSPMQLMLVLGHDRSSGSEPYPVASAFNGATMYPMDLVKSSGAQYDWGDDGQQCEHIGFNLALKKTMYVNPKWDLHLSPAEPGGPTGPRAMKTVNRIVFTPKISFPIFFQNLSCMLLFIHSVLVLSMKVLYRSWSKILRGTKVQRMILPWNAPPASKAKTLRVDLDSGSDYDDEEAGLLAGSSSKASMHDVRKRERTPPDSPRT
mmetsp:Transcript_10963/g.25843  ORF Transcript_10963/g.25843 Transcript_10963/m.25843 type:complete len:776 (-) Transcript_10963:143-2470(-)|eukprot:CAMPEP_0185811936 /NCGR_PEP_ID=MMETSP1322-20130828/8777_1 /TAXON_ID=265543 /ORGANISM="Minutocellus polymorphus, Strain RCC2270" /LENGTH=775 /DNA_ID=CAMNT_0028508437 /DNA_START=265 /DNA_END=2592 /DNA_ORIENTATION=+